MTDPIEALRHRLEELRARFGRPRADGQAAAPRPLPLSTNEEPPPRHWSEVDDDDE